MFHCKFIHILFAFFFLFLLKSTDISVQANQECVRAIGRLVCNKNQSKVIGAVVEVWDLDSPQNSNPFDGDDQAGFDVVEGAEGQFRVDGCASDHDWVGVNHPEFYIRIHHQCNMESGEYKTIFPLFRVYTPMIYNYHMEHPIVLDTPTGTTSQNFTNNNYNYSSIQTGGKNWEQMPREAWMPYQSLGNTEENTSFNLLKEVLQSKNNQTETDEAK